MAKLLSESVGHYYLSGNSYSISLSFVDRDMLMRYYWGCAPGHLYMYQGSLAQTITRPTHHTTGSRVEDTSQDNIICPENGQDITYEEHMQSGSESDGMDSNFNIASGSDFGSSSGRSEGSFEDEDDNNWEIQTTYKD